MENYTTEEQFGTVPNIEKPIKTKFVKVAVSERLPKKNGNYEVKIKPYQPTFVIFEKGNKYSDKFWNEKVEYFIEEVPDREEELKGILEEISINIDWSYDNWKSNDGKVLEQKISDLLQSLKQ